MKRPRTQLRRLADSRAWWRAYDDYLLTPAWRGRREVVLGKANWVCQLCQTRPATQAHHLRYPKGCVPGSTKWLRKERLSDLLAICERCHKGLHRAA